MSALTSSTQFPADLHRFDNGLTVIHQFLPSASVVAVDVWVKAGAIAEPDPWWGMAHFLEHMIFKGTDRLPAGFFDQAIENRGGATNAATSHDYAHYFIHTPAGYLEDTVPYLAELLLHAAIPDAEFDRERDVVLEEIRQAEDNPDWVGFQTLLESVYPQHPYGRSILGYAPLLMERSPDEMRCFHRAHYQPENMTVVVVGDVELEPTLALVNRTFNSFADRPTCPPTQIDADPPLIDIRRQELSLPYLEQARLMLAWVGPGVDQLQAAYGLDLISMVLTGGRSARLVRELREERQLVQAIDCSFSLQRDSSLFTIHAWLDLAHLDQVEAIIGDRLSQLADQPIGEPELNRCKRLLCNDYAFSTETSSQLAGLYGYYNTIAHAELAVAYPHHIQALQPETLQSLATQYLSPYRYAATLLKPLDNGSR